MLLLDLREVFLWFGGILLGFGVVFLNVIIEFFVLGGIFLEFGIGIFWEVVIDFFNLIYLEWVSFFDFGERSWEVFFFLFCELLNCRELWIFLKVFSDEDSKLVCFWEYVIWCICGRILWERKEKELNGSRIYV